MNEKDKARLLQGEHCSCGSHQLSISDDWYVQCKDCSDEWSAAELLVAEIKRLEKQTIFWIEKYDKVANVPKPAGS